MLKKNGEPIFTQATSRIIMPLKLLFGLGVRNHLPLRALILSDSRDQDLFSQVMDLQLSRQILPFRTRSGASVVT